MIKQQDVIYFGVPSAKMVLLVRQTPQTAVDVCVAGASAYATGMNTTVSVRMLRPFSVPQEWQLVENGEIAVEVRGDCSRISARTSWHHTSFVRSAFCSNLVFVRPARGTLFLRVDLNVVYTFLEKYWYQAKD